MNDANAQIDGQNAQGTAYPADGKNKNAYKTLNRILNRRRGGFYFLIASPRQQAAALKSCGDHNIAVYDFAQAGPDGRRLIELARIPEREPDKDAYVLLNFQLALWDAEARDGIGDWNIDAVRRLNYARDELIKLNKNMLFCLTKEADELLNWRAMDFYSFVKLFLRFEDEFTAETPQTVARPEDRSTGVDVIVDFRKSEEELLNQAIALSNQADELRDTFRYEDALHLYEKVLAIREKVLGKDHTDTAEIYWSIGYAYDAMGEYEKAVKKYQKFLDVYENDKNYGEEAPIVALLYVNIAISYQNMGKYEKALEYFQKSQTIIEKKFGEDNSIVSDTYANIAEIYIRLKKYNTAMEYYRKALAINENIRNESPEIARNYGNFGIIYSQMEEYAQALEWYHKALYIFEKTLGVKHIDTLKAYLYIAEAYEGIGDYMTAQIYRKKAQDAQKK